MGLPKQVLCFFCGSYRSRGREHAYADTWLQTLDAGQERIVLERRSFRTDTMEDARTQTFDSFLCGDICETCNKGWMSELEGAVKPWMLSITTKSDLGTLQAPARRTIFSRWAVKTACVIDHLGSTRSLQASHERSSNIRATCQLSLVLDADL
jgi:hypothetical protein